MLHLHWEIPFWTTGDEFGGHWPVETHVNVFISKTDPELHKHVVWFVSGWDPVGHCLQTPLIFEYPVMH